MTETNFTFRVDAELKAEFAEAAKASDRPASILLRDFMRDYVRRSRVREEHDAWFRAEVEQGLREADDPATKWIPHEQVMDEMEALLKDRIARATKRAG
jgi:predicted transcriptional regulator